MSTAHIPPENILDAAKERELVDVLVLGWDEDGRLYAASSSGRTEDIVELLNATRAYLKAQAA